MVDVLLATEFIITFFYRYGLSRLVIGKISQDMTQRYYNAGGVLLLFLSLEMLVYN